MNTYHRRIYNRYIIITLIPQNTLLVTSDVVVRDTIETLVHN